MISDDYPQARWFETLICMLITVFVFLPLFAGFMLLVWLIGGFNGYRKRAG